MNSLQQPIIRIDKKNHTRIGTLLSFFAVMHEVILVIYGSFIIALHPITLSFIVKDGMIVIYKSDKPPLESSSGVFVPGDFYAFVLNISKAVINFWGISSREHAQGRIFRICWSDVSASDSLGRQLGSKTN